MEHTLLIGAVWALFGWALVMMTMTIALAVYARAVRRRTARAIAHVRPSVEAFVLDGQRLEPASGRRREAQIELLLRYASLLRGGEAQRICRYLEDEGYIADAIQRLQSLRRWQRAESAAFLGRTHSPEAVEPLVTALRADPSDDVRSIAARGLAAFGDPAAVEALSQALADPSRWTSAEVATDLAEMGSPAVPALLTIAEQADDRAAVSAIRILGEIRDLRAGPVLREVLCTRSGLDLRAQAAAALGKIGGAEAVSALRAALRDPEWQVRAQSANALGWLGDPSCAGDLAEAMIDTSWWVRQNCADALARLGDSGQRELLGLAASRDRYVRERAAAALEKLPQPEPGQGGPQVVPA